MSANNGPLFFFTEVQLFHSTAMVNNYFEKALDPVFANKLAKFILLLLSKIF